MTQNYTDYACRFAEELAKPASFQDRSFSEAIERLDEVIRQGGFILVCGNGGSALDALHIVSDLSHTGKYSKSPRSVALSDNVSNITAISNDFDFEEVFSRQVRVIGNAGDALVCISTSGESRNVVKAAEVAKELGMVVVSLTNANDSDLDQASDISIQSRFCDTNRAQEEHRIMYHHLCNSILRRSVEND